MKAELAAQPEKSPGKGGKGKAAAAKRQKEGDQHKSTAQSLTTPIQNPSSETTISTKPKRNDNKANRKRGKAAESNGTLIPSSTAAVLTGTSQIGSSLNQSAEHAGAPSNQPAKQQTQRSPKANSKRRNRGPPKTATVGSTS